jgi:signal transduction histidine kinase
MGASAAKRGLDLANGHPANGDQATEFGQAQAALAERERQLADQLDRLNCVIATAIPGVLITDERGLITHASESFGALFGIEFPGRLVGSRAVDAVGRIKHVFAEPGDFVRRTSEAFSARKPKGGQQIPCVDGRTLECDYWPILGDGRYRGDVWLAWDRSARKALEQEREHLLDAELAARRLAELGQRQLEAQNQELQQLDEAKSLFVAAVSHELRTPLTSIVSFSELMRAETSGLTADGAQFLDIIERNAHRLLHLVGDLLLLSRLESRTIPLDLEAVSVPELAEEATRAATAGAAKHGVTIHLSASDGPRVQADHDRMMQVLDNLIANAVKFSRPNGLIRVETTWDDGMWRIEVADSGIGIPPDELSQLFGRFVRASNARTSGRPGTGLGLTIVKAIVEMHGGRVTVESTLGSGTTFTVHLPADA